VHEYTQKIDKGGIVGDLGQDIESEVSTKDEENDDEDD
jgi:hypothetical protein